MDTYKRKPAIVSRLLEHIIAGFRTILCDYLKPKLTPALYEVYSALLIDP